MTAIKRNRLIVALAIALGVCVFVIGDLAVQRAQARFVIEQFQMRWAAGLEEIDDALRLWREMRLIEDAGERTLDRGDGGRSGRGPFEQAGKRHAGS